MPEGAGPWEWGQQPAPPFSSPPTTAERGRSNRCSRSEVFMVLEYLWLLVHSGKLEL